MRISKEETAANRAKVLAAAARLFREKGVDGIAVAELMQAAGLTHGGFYNHFESKEELAAAAFREAFAKIMPGDASEQRTEAITVLSTLIGALTLSRACVGADDALADEVIATVRDQLRVQDQ